MRRPLLKNWVRFLEYLKRGEIRSMILMRVALGRLPIIFLKARSAKCKVTPVLFEMISSSRLMTDTKIGWRISLTSDRQIKTHIK